MRWVAIAAGVVTLAPAAELIWLTGQAVNQVAALWFSGPSHAVNHHLPGGLVFYLLATFFQSGLAVWKVSLDPTGALTLLLHVNQPVDWVDSGAALGVAALAMWMLVPVTGVYSWHLWARVSSKVQKPVWTFFLIGGILASLPLPQMLYWYRFVWLRWAQSERDSG